MAFRNTKPRASAPRPRTENADRIGPTHEASETFGHFTGHRIEQGYGLARNGHMPVIATVRGSQVSQAPLERVEQNLLGIGDRVQITARPGNADPDREGVGALDAVVAPGESAAITVTPTSRVPLGIVAVLLGLGVVYLVRRG